MRMRWRWSGGELGWRRGVEFDGTIEERMVAHDGVYLVEYSAVDCICIKVVADLCDNVFGKMQGTDPGADLSGREVLHVLHINAVYSGNDPCLPGGTQSDTPKLGAFTRIVPLIQYMYMFHVRPSASYYSTTSTSSITHIFLLVSKLKARSESIFLDPNKISFFS